VPQIYVQARRSTPHEEASMSHQDQSPHEPPSLYDRLGGVYAIATVVDDFIDRIMVDPRLNANPRVDEAHHRVSPPGFKYLVTEMVCWATGGPQRYSGRTMEDAHRHLRITADEWRAFLDDLRQTLDRFDVPARERRELVAIVESTHEAIVGQALVDGAAARAGAAVS
jgi:hemoglobin